MFASLLPFAIGCQPDSGASLDNESAVFEGDGGLDDKAAATRFKVRNAGTGTCLKRSSSLKVGNGYEVYQTACSENSDGMWWRQQCAGSVCKYVNDATDYCLKASGSVRASGGSLNVYAARCSSDSDQNWFVKNVSGKLQLQNDESRQCAYASQGEKTSDGNFQIVQRSCGTSTKLLFEHRSSGDDGGGSAGGTTGSTTGGTTGSTTGSTTGGTTGSGGVTHVGTTKVYDSNGQGLTIARPSGSRAGDLLVLVLHRTDDDLPLFVDGWTRAAECYKRDNGYDCSTEEDCTRWHNDDFCAYFGDRGREGHDLAQSVFYRTVGASERSSYVFNLNVDSSGHPGWAILTALRGAATTDPVRAWDNEGCDNNPDSVFPSVYGRAGDMLLLSQSYDDQVAQAKFGAPPGMSTFGYVSQSDEAGFLFGKQLTSTGETGVQKTQGDGASGCKDALVSLTIKAR